MSAYGTVTRSAPAGRRPPEPPLQIHLFMNPLHFFSLDALHEVLSTLLINTERKDTLIDSGATCEVLVTVARAYMTVHHECEWDPSLQGLLTNLPTSAAGIRTEYNNGNVTFGSAWPDFDPSLTP